MIYPKDGLIRKYNLTVMLGEDLKTYDETLLHKALLYRNEALGGELAVTHVKRFAASDKTKEGKSKEGWKLVRLQGNEQFMDSLYQFPMTHRFKVGSGRVMIRGGNRRDLTETERAAETAWRAIRDARQSRDMINKDVIRRVIDGVESEKEKPSAANGDKREQNG